MNFMIKRRSVFPSNAKQNSYPTYNTYNPTHVPSNDFQMNL